MHASQKVLVSLNHLAASPTDSNLEASTSVCLKSLYSLRRHLRRPPTMALSYNSKGVNNFGKLDGPSQAPQSFDPRQGCSGYCETCHADYL
jgi:hypothetical protein